ncbi:actin-domain-containing protein [Neocallimastix lanati (nom. inval.)]|nr:actin-domain-containing protein [Neocallimastix sp. JGI-2020a]
MDEDINDILITSNFIKEINATIFEYFSDYELRSCTINNLFNELDKKIKRKSALDARKFANKFLNNIFAIQKVFFDWAISRTTQQEEELYSMAIRKRKERLPSIKNKQVTENTKEKSKNDNTDKGNLPGSISDDQDHEHYKPNTELKLPNNNSLTEEKTIAELPSKGILNKKLAFKDIQEKLRLITPLEYSKLDVDINPIVIDIGSYTCKVGFIRKTQPEFLIHSLLGTLNEYQLKVPTYFGLKALKYSTKSTLHSLIDKNAKLSVTSLYLEKFLKYIMVQLKVDKYVCPEDMENRTKGVRIILNELSMDYSYKEKMLSLLFNRFNVNAIAFLNPAELAISDPVSTGVVVDIGDSTTKIVPICRGKVINSAQYAHDIAGYAMVSYLINLLENRYKYKFNGENPGHGFEMARKIKEKFCYVAQNFIEERSEVIGQYVELPNGQLIIMDIERIQCPEILFQPNLIGRNQIKSLSCLIEKVINKCESVHHDELYNNIILTGGSSCFNGLKERIQKDLSILNPNRQISVKSFPHRKTTWISTAIYDKNRYNWINRDEWRSANHQKNN